MVAGDNLFLICSRKVWLHYLLMNNNNLQSTVPRSSALCFINEVTKKNSMNVCKRSRNSFLLTFDYISVYCCSASSKSCGYLLCVEQCFFVVVNVIVAAAESTDQNKSIFVSACQLYRFRWRVKPREIHINTLTPFVLFYSVSVVGGKNTVEA